MEGDLIPILTQRYLCCLRHMLLDVLQLYNFVAPSSAPRYRYDLELELEGSLPWHHPVFSPFCNLLL